jgi:hypothetical protein
MVKALWENIKISGNALWVNLLLLAVENNYKTELFLLSV